MKTNCFFTVLHKMLCKKSSSKPPSLHANVAVPYLILVQVTRVYSFLLSTLAYFNEDVSDELTFVWFRDKLFPDGKNTGGFCIFLRNYYTFLSIDSTCFTLGICNYFVPRVIFYILVIIYVVCS